MSGNNDTGQSRPKLPLRKRITLSVVGGFLMTATAIGIVVATHDILAYFGLDAALSVPVGTYATAFAVLWFAATGTLTVLLHRLRGTATANKDGVGVDLHGEV